MVGSLVAPLILGQGVFRQTLVRFLDLIRLRGLFTAKVHPVRQLFLLQHRFLLEFVLGCQFVKRFFRRETGQIDPSFGVVLVQAQSCLGAFGVFRTYFAQY